MLENIKIPKISQTHLHGIKDLSVEDINNILELSKIFKEHNKDCLLYTSDAADES